MQLMIDTMLTPTKQLRAIAALFIEVSDDRDATAAFLDDPTEDAPTAAELDAAAIGFGKAPLSVTEQVNPLTYAAPDPARIGQGNAGGPVTPNASASVVVGPEVDGAGVVYNPALHSSSKAKNKDGTWKKRRGATAIPAAPVTPPAPATTAAPPAIPMGDDTSVIDAAALAAAIAAATPPPPPPPPPPQAATQAAIPPPPPPPPAPSAPVDAPNFRSIVAKINAATAANKLTHARVGQLLVSLGLPADGMQLLLARGDLHVALDNLLTAELAGK